MAKKTSENKAEGRGKAERARLIRLEDVENESREPKLKRKKANGGEDWACKVLTSRAVK